MVRTAPRGTTTVPEVELLDRTGIVAASLPQRRRTVIGRSPLDGSEQHDKDWDLRPKSVVIQRRIKTWLGTCTAVALVMTGWITGGAFDGPETQTAAPVPVEIQERAAEQPPAPVPVQVEQPPNPGPAPVPVAKKPAGQKQTRTPATSKKPAKSTSTAPSPRIDLPKPTKQKDPVEEFMQQYVDQFVKVTITRG
ncbi:hypothetical protein SAMN05421504_11517 [Amycolatopsis xylanica]|uniref:Uncharacterized protein n=1 Tax=Amycolatopsis xylanica TaxID=589385 RepID=A0A1H3SR25_9PSEU|nr:hypothetical protein [Amycolatopsis xylanica]SDZ40147.1 hypothetical protein SAMN05421504_11517 [Amycolatopsis xylanica]